MLMSLPEYVHTVLPHVEWTRLQRDHERRVHALIGPHVARRSRHEKDPVADFLFEYYRYRPGALALWSPGFGVGIDAVSEDARPSGWDAALVRTAPSGTAYLSARAFPERRLDGTRFIHGTLMATDGRPPLFGCSGLHEWAMVYRTPDIRHDQLPMRLSDDDIAHVVDQGPLCCTHYDAFRFFTPAAAPLNRTRLTPDDIQNRDQSGCLHVNMDLYRWAFKRAPWIASDIILDALELAFEIRTVDMQASPYDLSGQGLDAIPIETEAGRAAYVERQRAFHLRALPLRKRLIHAYRELLSAVEHVDYRETVS